MRADQPVMSNLATDRRYLVGITGTGAADPTKRYGDGITVTRTAVGVFKFAFASHPGYFKGFACGLRATTPGDVKGHTVTGGDFTAATATASAFISLSLWSSTFAADELNALEFLDVQFMFSELSI